MKTNRQRVIEKLLDLANIMRRLRENASAPKRPQISLWQLIEYDGDVQGMPEDVFDASIDVLHDPEAMQVYGWLEGLAETNGFENVREMLGAADIGHGLLDPAPHTAPEPAAARAYKAILEAIQVVLREKLGRMDAVIIRSVEAPVIDEMARNAAQSVVAELEV